jgi:hypothetical protein
MRCWAAVIVALSTAAAAQAQDAQRFGVTMGYPASIGVMWRIADRVAVRPEVSLQKISTTTTAVITLTSGFGPNVTTTTTTSQNTSDQWSVGVGASALIYLKRWDALRTYVTPRFVYSRGSTNSSAASTFPGIPPSANEFTQNSYFAGGSFGAEYSLASRFGVYGELGLGYTYQTSENSSTPAGSSTVRTIGTRSGAGVILYF